MKAPARFSLLLLFILVAGYTIARHLHREYHLKKPAAPKSNILDKEVSYSGMADTKLTKSIKKPDVEISKDVKDIEIPTISNVDSVQESDSNGESSKVAGTKLCVIARTFSQNYDHIATFLMSLSQNYVARPFVYMLRTDDTSSFSDLKVIIDKVNDFLGYEIARVLPDLSKEARKISKMYLRDYGYSFTDAAIDFIIENSTDCDYMMFTNGDNIYVSGFIDNYVYYDMVENVDVIAFDFVSHYGIGLPKNQIMSDRNQEIYDDGSHKHVEADFFYGKIDVGAFIIKMTMLAKESLRFVSIAQSSRWAIKGAGSYLVEYAAKIAESLRIHRQVLLIHQ